MRTWLVGWTSALCLVAPAVASPEGVTGHDLEVGSFQVGAFVETAATLTVDLEIRNRGEVTWSPDNGFAIAYHWFGADGGVVVWDGVRSPLLESLRPGEDRVVGATLRAPDRAGEYLLQWDVVQEGRLWISEVDTTPVDLTPVRVAPTHAFSLLEVKTPRLFRAGGERCATVVVRNDGTRIWPGDGSVVFASHWRAMDGEVALWEGHRTAVTRSVAPGESIELEVMAIAPESIGRFGLQWDMVADGVCWFSERDPDPEPVLDVLVVPGVVVAPFMWTILVALAAASAFFGSGHRNGLARGWAVADVIWCLAAVILKQVWVLSGAGLGFSVGGWWLACATGALIGLILLVLPQRLRPWASWVVAALVTAVLFADLIHERFFGDLTSLAALHSAGQIGRIGDSVRSLLVPGDLWFWADLPAALLLVWSVARMRPGAMRRGRLAAVFGLAALGCGLVGSIVTRGAPISFRQVFHTTHLARHIGVLNLHAFDLGATTARNVFRSELDEDELFAVVKYFDDRRESRGGSGPFFGAAAGRNLVMIQVESLQAFVIGFSVGGQEVTPFLNGLAAGNFFFANVTDQTEEGRSSDSELATQVSLLPPDRGAAAFLYADNEFTGLASVLAERGYETLSAVPFEGSFWNRRATHRAYGYERNLFVDDFGPGEEIGWGLNDRDFLSQAVARLTELPEPWCAYLLTLSLHHPFDGFPEHQKTLDLGDWEGTPFGNYLHTMHHFDRALADFVATLDGTGLGDRTVLALWGDHDAGFEWRSEIATAMGATHDATGWYLSQRVPLLIRVPEIEAPAEALDVPAGHVDVAPTLLALLGVDPAPFAFTGRNLLGSPGPGPVIGEYRCWRDRTHLYLRRGPLLSDGECIELATSREVGSGACAAGFEAARREVEISQMVLEHDLQQNLGKSLAQRP